MSIPGLRGLAAICLITAIASGCTQKVGRAFVRPNPANLTLGVTTKNDILALVGPPQGEANKFGSLDDKIVKPVKTAFDPASLEGSFSQIKYEYAEAKPPLEGGDTSLRVMTFLFYNGKLIAYDFLSSFANDSSNFDESRLSALEKGQTTEEQVDNILGTPAGKAIYPVILTPDTMAYNYSYASREMVSNGLFTTGDISYKLTNKHLSIIFGPDHKIIDYRLASDSSGVTVPIGGSGTVTPIIIPSHK